MKNFNLVQNYPTYFGLFCLLIIFNSCSKDDDADQPETYGKISIGEWTAMEGKTLIIPAITVKQISWLTAVEMGEDDTNNFIAQPVKVSLGTHENVRLFFDENFTTDREIGHPILLKLYADNPSGGVKGEWDETDVLIRNAKNEQFMTMVTVYEKGPEFGTFEAYDINYDGVLDETEAWATYNFTNYFSNFENKENFYSFFFSNSDFDSSNSVSREEWYTNFNKLLSHWTSIDFNDLDTEKEGVVNRTEWLNIFSESGWFEAYDVNHNSQVSYEEWAAGIFKEWDTDHSGTLDQIEFQSYYPLVVTWWRW